jgi:hypothetical protein
VEVEGAGGGGEALLLLDEDLFLSVSKECLGLGEGLSSFTVFFFNGILIVL